MLQANIRFLFTGSNADLGRLNLEWKGNSMVEFEMFIKGAVKAFLQTKSSFEPSLGNEWERCRCSSTIINVDDKTTKRMSFFVDNDEQLMSVPKVEMVDDSLSID